MTSTQIKICTLLVAIFTLYGCDKGTNSATIEKVSAPKAVSKWVRDEKKDPFDDSVFLRYSLDNEGGNGSAFLLVDCNKQKNIRFNWQYGQGEKGAPFGPMDMKVEVRLDNGPVTEQEWEWSASAPMLRPKNITEFLDGLVSKNKVALREGITQTTMVFDITGFDDLYNDVKKACSK